MNANVQISWTGHYPDFTLAESECSCFTLFSACLYIAFHSFVDIAGTFRHMKHSFRMSPLSSRENTDTDSLLVCASCVQRDSGLEIIGTSCKKHGVSYCYNAPFSFHLIGFSYSVSTRNSPLLPQRARRLLSSFNSTGGSESHFEIR